MLNSKQILEVLRKDIKKAGTQKDWALKHKLSPAFINDVLQGKRSVSDTIAEALGYDRLVMYSKR